MATVYLAGKVGGQKWNVMPELRGISYTASDADLHARSADAEREERLSRGTDDWVDCYVVTRLSDSSALCAYLDTSDCYGSIAEIAYASALHIPCFVWIENPGAESDDAYWLVTNLPGVLTHHKGEKGSAGATEFFAAILGQLLAESPIEQSLWVALAIRCFRGSLAFPVAQFEIDKYRLDFAWPDICVAIEVDGHDYHKTKEQRSYDARRDRVLLGLGWNTLRYTGSDVYKDVGSVADEIISFVAPKLQSVQQNQPT